MRIFCMIIAVLFSFRVLAQEEIFPPQFLPETGDLSETFEPRVSPLPEDLPPPQEVQPTEKKLEEKIKEEEEGTKEPKVKVEGAKVYLDFRDTDIREVARVLSKISGVSIIVTDDVRTKVTLNIEGVDWKTALELILKAYNLAYVEKDNFLIILTYQRLKKEEEDVPLVTKIITLNFVDINQAKKYLSAIKSKRGSIEGDLRTNSLIITDTPEAIEQIGEIVKKLDKKTPQVLIEVLMVDRKIIDDFDLGVEWTLEQDSSFDRMVRQSFQSVGDFTLQYGKAVGGMASMDTLLKALKENSNTAVLANPRVITLDNVPAEINITDQVPYVSESTNADGNTVTTTQFKEVGIKLNVKPHITPDSHIIMDIATEQSFVDRFVTSGGTSSGAEQPVIGTRKSVNTMLVKNRETIVIGGLRKREKKETVDKVPLLGDIPFLRFLFSRQSYDDEIRELMIFVTPRIQKRPRLGDEERQNLSHSEGLQSATNLLREKAEPAKEAIKQAKKYPQEDIEVSRIEPFWEEKQETESEIMPDFQKLELMPLKGPNDKD